MAKKEEINDYSWALRGKQRQKVLLAMGEEAKIPTQIKQESSLSLNNVSDILRLMTKLKLAKCLNPEAKTGRLYTLTERGKVVRDKLKSTYSTPVSDA